mmetsp:Transcript_4310/g.15172  ORF Transcript_4310/g.15172 Transcript_4310/m.15172 type:complete len:237 (-) Transcript_4310:118-828(-)
MALVHEVLPEQRQVRAKVVVLRRQQLHQVLKLLDSPVLVQLECSSEAGEEVISEQGLVEVAQEQLQRNGYGMNLYAAGKGHLALFDLLPNCGNFGAVACGAEDVRLLHCGEADVLDHRLDGNGNAAVVHRLDRTQGSGERQLCAAGIVRCRHAAGCHGACRHSVVVGGLQLDGLAAGLRPGRREGGQRLGDVCVDLHERGGKPAPLALRLAVDGVARVIKVKHSDDLLALERKQLE